MTFWDISDCFVMVWDGVGHFGTGWNIIGHFRSFLGV